MTKAEIIAKVSQQTGLKRSQVEKVLESLIDTLAVALSKRERIALPGLGIFSVKERKERKGRNPKTGEEITIPGKKVPRFTPSKILTQAVNK